MGDLMVRTRRVAVESRISENIAALCRRAGTNQTRLAGEVGLTVASMSRKMAGGPWLYTEVVALAAALGVTPEELAGQLPDREEWRARRDSNPKPSDQGPARARAPETGSGRSNRLRLVSVNPDLTPFRPVEVRRTRHLRAV